LQAELGEDRYRPHPLLRRMVAAGLETFGDLSSPLWAPVAQVEGDLQISTAKEAK